MPRLGESPLSTRRLQRSALSDPAATEMIKAFVARTGEADARRSANYLKNNYPQLISETVRAAPNADKSWRTTRQASHSPLITG